MAERNKYIPPYKKELLKNWDKLRKEILEGMKKKKIKDIILVSE